MILGKYITEGRTRKIYAHPDNDEYIIKVHKSEWIYNSNKIEWRIWQTCNSELRKLLVPCIHLVSNGKYLIMLRGVPANEDYQPQIIPEIIDSQRWQNWVKLRGIYQLCDYGHINSLKRLKKEVEEDE